MSEAIKPSGWQPCDNCGRDFEVVMRVKSDWVCPHCGFDNRVGKEFATNAQRVATKRSRQARKKNGEE